MMNWYQRLCAQRKRQNYKHSAVGSKKPEDWLRRPTPTQMRAIARQFAKKGETNNALETLRLINPEAKIAFCGAQENAISDRN